MVRDLQKIIDVFYNQHQPKRKEYSTLYRVFVEYANSHTEHTIDTKEFVSAILNKDYIIDSCVQYFSKGRAHKESAIKKYLNAMTYMYKNCFQVRGWRNSTLESFLPFSTLSDEVKQRLRNIPEKNTPIPPISEERFAEISQYLNHDFKRNSRSKKQFYIICNFFLFLGFKFERLSDLRVSDYIFEKKAISVHTDVGTTIEIQLPIDLSDCLEEYLNEYQGNPDDYLFVNTKGQKIKATFLETYFKPLRKKHERTGPIKNYNATGFAKFGIIELLHEGLEPYFIQMITGMDHIIIDDCVKIYLEKKYVRMSDQGWLTSYINSVVGNIKTFKNWPQLENQ